MSSQICLKWNSFLSNIATSFESLWEEEGLVDVTLASDGQCLTAHKVILSASSPFFKKVFQTNPCQHPVIILQDVHFSELEALLIFIYKGEVNIEQKNLPALLKAAETLQIRGLSGGDIFAKESYKRLAEFEQEVLEDAPLCKEDNPKKKQKFTKPQNNSILEKALTPRISQSESTNESTTSEQSGKDPDFSLSEGLSNPIYQRLEMKIEPLEMTVDEIQKRSPCRKDSVERLDPSQVDGSQGSSKPIVTVIAEARQTSPCRSPGQRGFCERQENAETSPKREPQQPPPASPDYSECKVPEAAESSNITTVGISEPAFSNFNVPKPDLPEEISKSGPAFPPFPCPFCDRAYTSWGFRRRHIKAVHTISPSLNCKWCLQINLVISGIAYSCCLEATRDNCAQSICDRCSQWTFNSGGGAHGAANSPTHQTGYTGQYNQAKFAAERLP
ncbi:broad-complex core protein isoforms 1/2/3/4/5-like isoform X2 [Prorops nasuta]|uniref:broad-complex core protein isoforms 1/2/3/4/5-like isoform X2 n=1 Tax=Prorops nasuta TaxID=863751 RepID=UPI0034CD743F